MKKLWGEFVAFIFGGNILMLAVAFVLGLLTKQVIDSFVNDIVNPIIGAIVGKPEFTNTLSIGDGVIRWGSFLTVIINLILTGLVLFGVVRVYDAYRERRKTGEEEEALTEDIELLRQIRDLLAAQSAT